MLISQLLQNSQDQKLQKWKLFMVQEVNYFVDDYLLVLYFNFLTIVF